MSDDLERRVSDMLEHRGRVADATVSRVVATIDRLPDRRRRLPMVRAIAVAVAVLLVAVAFSATLVMSPRGPDVLAPSPSATASPTLQARPVWARDLVDHLRCDGPPSVIGSEITSETAAMSDAAYPAPDAAFEAIRRDYSMLPSSGFTPVLVDEHWALRRYLVDGQAKVHMVATDQLTGIAPGNGWRVVGLRMCDPSEF